MKNISKYIIALSLLFSIALFFNACEEDSSDLEYNGNALVSFAQKIEGVYYVKDDEGDADTIKVGINKPAPKDLEFSVIVDPTSTAVDGSDFTIETKTIVIKKGEVEGIIVVNGKYSALPDCSPKVLNLKLDGENATEYDNMFTLNLNKYFPFDITGFEGTYTVNDVSDYDGEVDPYNLVTEAGEGDTLIATGIWGFPVPINVVLNPNDFSLNIPKQLFFVHGTYGDVFIESVNTGSFKVCDNSLSLNYTIYADAGTFDKVSSSEWVIAGKSGKINFDKNIDALQLK